MLPILIVDDEPHIARLIEMTLEPLGQPLVLACDGEQAADLLEKQQFDLVLLDVMLPGVDGFALMDYIAPTGTPVIFLTAKNAVADRVRGLKLGAYDYIVKPFAPAELLARVRVALRLNRYSRTGDAASGGEFQAQGLRINYDRRKVFVEGQEVRLTQTEYNIVAFLSQHAGRVMTYAAIVRAIWGDTDVGSTKKLQVNMANIRKKLGSRPGSNPYILNELGVGYRMIDEDPESRQTAEEGA
jgi:two-component system KDP operon response regulator KdpE